MTDTAADGKKKIDPMDMTYSYDQHVTTDPNDRTDLLNTLVEENSDS